MAETKKKILAVTANYIRRKEFEKIAKSCDIFQIATFGKLKKVTSWPYDLLVVDREIIDQEDTWDWLANNSVPHSLPPIILMGAMTDKEAIASYKRRLSAAVINGDVEHVSTIPPHKFWKVIKSLFSEKGLC